MNRISGMPNSNPRVNIISSSAGPQGITGTRLGPFSEPLSSLPEYYEVTADNWSNSWGPYMNNVLLNNPPSEIDTETWGTIPGTGVYRCGVLATNGIIYSAPVSGSSNILKVDVASRTITELPIPSGISSFGAGSLAPNGVIYFAPYSSGFACRVDPASDSVTLQSFSLDLSGSGMWSCTVLGPDGKIYCMPRNSVEVLIINPDANTASLNNYGLSFSGTQKYYTGSLGPDGKIYCPQFLGGNTTLVIDPLDNSAILTNFGLDMASINWPVSSIGPDGKIYCARNDNTLIIDPLDNSAIFSDLGIDFAMFGSVLGPDGLIYTTPLSSIVDSYSIDISVPSATSIGNITAGDYHNGIAAFDGNIYFLPADSSVRTILQLNAAPGLTIPDEKLLLSPYMNTYGSVDF